MRKCTFCRTIALIVCLSLLPLNSSARAQSLQTTSHEIVGGAIAIVAAVAVIVVVLVVHKKPASVKGCVASGPNGLQLLDSDDKLTYELFGDTSDIKAGDLIKVKGKKKHGKGSVGSSFEVTQLSKDYGACPATANP